MRAVLDTHKSSVVSIAILTLVAMTLAISSAAQDVARDQPTQAASPPQTKPERFWIAGRYDGNRVIVYFDAVKFDGTMPSIAEELPEPVASGFFMPKKLPWAYVAKLQQGPDAERFKIGDKFDLLLDAGKGCVKVAVITLTTIIGTEGDEPVGNDSYIGALAKLDEKDDVFLLAKSYYVVRRHRELAIGVSQPNVETVLAGMENEPGHEPVRFNIQTQILDLLTQRMKASATESQRREAQGVSPIFEVQSFRVADGTLRYYARAAWRWKEDTNSYYALAAWISPQPTLHILAVQMDGPWYDTLETVFPSLLNVVDLGGGRTGILLSISGGDSSATQLREYRDGLDFQHMPVLQSIEAGE